MTTVDKDATWSKSSVVIGHHIYKMAWMPYVGQCLQLSMKKTTNMTDFVCVCVCVGKASGNAVRHARTFCHFLRGRGKIECGITAEESRRKCVYGLLARY